MQKPISGKIMAEQENKGNRRKIIQVLGLLLLLVLLPLGSWYYLQQGLDYRLSALHELEDFGALPAFTLRTIDGQPLERADLAGKVVIAAFMTTGDAGQRQNFGEELRRLHLQFDEGDGVVFLTHLLDTLADTPEAVARFASDYELNDEQQCFFLTGPPATIRQLAGDAYKIPGKLEGNTYLALTDTTLTVRKHFDIAQPEEVKRLVEIVAIILPQVKERDLVFKREQEK